MKTIEYRVTYAEGHTDIVRVQARDINSGFTKAVKLARRETTPRRPGDRRWEIAIIEFWTVTS